MKLHLKELAEKNRGWSLYKLAQELKISQQTVYSWTNSRTEPSFFYLDRICTILNCDIGDLLENEKKTSSVNR